MSRALLSRYYNPEGSGSFRKSRVIKIFQILVALAGYSRGIKNLQVFGGGSSAVLAEWNQVSVACQGSCPVRVRCVSGS